MSHPAPRSRSAVAAHPITSAVIAILVVADIFFALYTPLYSRITPKLGDFPFFYWYLLIYMPVTSLVLLIVLQLQKLVRAPATDAEGGAA
jgi:hypothetical protein